ncbi:MAG TPA: hypothetical protein VFP98_06420, partial [Candidatus Polarisedimenticolia bacterium]|nr:hypothetical protein [Candidatus Polarisedimenticolia bacterium]
LRQIKNDVFDQRWDAVLGSCDRFISSFTSSTALPRAYYYRAQALEHTKGREADAIEAYGTFLTKFPRETGALREDAVLSRMTMATSLCLKGDRRFTGVIMDGMDERGYPRIFAAIQASKCQHAPARTKAVPILKQCAASEPDVELKNECVVALLIIDPRALPPTPPAPPVVPRAPGAPPASPAPGDAKLIRVEVFDKASNKVAVRVNLPIAFADLLLQSLGDELKPELERHLQTKFKGMDMQKMWDAIRKGGKQILLEVDIEDQKIKVWTE